MHYDVLILRLNLVGWIFTQPQNQATMKTRYYTLIDDLTLMFCEQWYRLTLKINNIEFVDVSASTIRHILKFL